MSYSILISAQTSKADTTQQHLIVARTDSAKEVLAWSRVTNGGRGEGNAWSDVTYSELQTQLLNAPNLIVGEILSSPLTDKDIEALDSNERPNVLIQKLTKQYGLRHTNVSTQTLGEVVKEVCALIAQDPDSLSTFRSDGRSDKSATKTPTVEILVPAHVETVVVREPMRNKEGELVNRLATIPNPELVNGYIEREFFGVTETEIYDKAIKEKKNVLLKGHAGTGKTSSVMAYASKRGLPFYCVNFNAGIETSQLFGSLLPNESGNLYYQDGGLTECWRGGGAVLLDELSFINTKQSGGLHPSLDGRRQLVLLNHNGEVIEAHPNLLIVGAYNDGYRGTGKFNQAFADRFSQKLTFEYDINIERNFIKSEALLELAQSMRVSDEYETPVSTRLLKEFVANVKAFNYEYAVYVFLNNFTDEEVASVQLLLEAQGHNIKSQLV